MQEELTCKNLEEKELDSKTLSYDYHLPKELIATSPAKPADSAKLLVYNRATKSITHSCFSKLLDFIPKETTIFLNDTKVIKARLFGVKESGGKIELLLLKPLANNRYSAMIRGRVKSGTEIFFEQNLSAIVEKLASDGSREISFLHNKKPIHFEQLIDILELIGHIPLPPYMNREDRQEDELDYQTLFAKNAGSVAAPTASLHFTPELLANLQSRHQTHTLTLHVGAGTFKPVEVDDILNHPMHSEYYDIPTDAIETIKSSKKILAVGTTSTRTIEYFVRTQKPSGECNLFLHPGNPPERVDHLLTNFHLPKSTLIMLVSAFLGRDETLRVYNSAIEHRYRFYSYGDGMLIL